MIVILKILAALHLASKEIFYSLCRRSETKTQEQRAHTPSRILRTTLKPEVYKP